MRQANLFLIEELIIKNKEQIKIVNPVSNNYTGNGNYLKSLNINLN